MQGLRDRCSPLPRCRLIQNEQDGILTAASSIGRSLEGKSAGARRTHSTVSARRLRLQPRRQFRSSRCSDGSSRSHGWLHGQCAGPRRAGVRPAAASVRSARARGSAITICHNDFPFGGRYSTLKKRIMTSFG